jgi:hypothetical protein
LENLERVLLLGQETKILKMPAFFLSVCLQDFTLEVGSNPCSSSTEQ